MDIVSYYAHTREGRLPPEWEPLEEHLQAVAKLAEDFAGAFGAKDWGRVVGLWHDLGKYSREFQQRLWAANSPQEAGMAAQRVDHSTAGAKHAVEQLPGLAGKIAAYCIAGHHAGLPDHYDADGGTTGLADRVKKPIPRFDAAPREILSADRPGKLALDLERNEAAGFQLATFCRMLFSALVDADYLATEEFMRSDRAARRRRPILCPEELLPYLDKRLERLATEAEPSPVNERRQEVLVKCREKAELPPGLFSLTVPTGGGKTLSSLAFALTHAARHGMRRVIYAIPFTSIIEQTAHVFREALQEAGQDCVLEHHCNFDPDAGKSAYDDEPTWPRLAAENWDAPVIVTTNVQLFESLFANRPSRCRKLHRIARSVIILDECQSLPVELLAPTLRMLEELCRNYGCSVVLCSATQPALERREDFRIGLAGVREIVDDRAWLYSALRRVEIQQRGHLDDEKLAEELAQPDNAQVLCVVNTRAHAARVFRLLRERCEKSDVFHLSAQMCAAHRTEVLAEIRHRLKEGLPVRVISTQLIEAGVDVDFPVVYRAMAGVDSIAQAAGRCNREGRRPRGVVHVFETDVKPTHQVKQAAQHAREIAQLHDDLLSLEAIEQYFRLHYWSRSDEWDKKKILKLFALSDAHFQFRQAAEKYRLIEEEQQSVIVPYGADGRRLVEQIRRMTEPPGRGIERRAQGYVVSVHEQHFRNLRQNGLVQQYADRFWVLEDPTAYDEVHLGLLLDAPGLDAERFIL